MPPAITCLLPRFSWEKVAEGRTRDHVLVFSLVHPPSSFYFPKADFLTNLLGALWGFRRKI
jgi:hypothetical protein